MCKTIMKKSQLIKKPAPVVTTFSESTVKDLFAIQSEYMLKQLNNVMLRCRVFSRVGSQKDTIEAQLKYFDGVSNELSEITGQEIRLLKFHKHKLIDIVDRNMVKAPLMSVSYQVAEGKKISVVSVQNHYAHMSPSHNKEINQHSEGALKSGFG